MEQTNNNAHERIDLQIIATNNTNSLKNCIKSFQRLMLLATSLDHYNWSNDKEYKNYYCQLLLNTLYNIIIKIYFCYIKKKLTSYK